MGETDRIRELESELARVRAELAELRATDQRAERRLVRAEQEWERTFDSVPDLVAIIDREHRILRVNRAMAKRLGKPAEQCMGQPCYVCVHGLDAPPDFCPHTQTVADGREHTAEVHEERLEGDFLVSCTPLFDESGNFTASIQVARDITGQKRAEREAATAATHLSNALDRLRALNATLEQRVVERTAVAERRAEQLRRLASQLARAEERERHRVARVLHDQLQQLLVGARLKITLLRRRLDGEKATQTANEVDQLIQQCIDESRSLTGQLSPPVLYDAGLVAGLEWLARQMGQQWDLSVEVQASPATEPADEGIRVLLFQVARELLLNVAKHSQSHLARVELTALANGRLRIEVLDEGAGFDPSSIEDQAQTNGFGLFSLRERLESMGGSFQLITAPGEGTRAIAEVPADIATAV